MLQSAVSGLMLRSQLIKVKTQVQFRGYQSDRGVYGYKKKPARPTSGNELIWITINLNYLIIRKMF